MRLDKEAAPRAEPRGRPAQIEHRFRMSLVTNDEDSNAPVPSNSAYEIAMVATAGGIMLLCGTMFIVLVLKRLWNDGKIYDNYPEEGTASNINLTRAANENVSTANLRGPVHVSYINEKGIPPAEIPVGKVKLSREALLYISLLTCMNLPDDVPSEEGL